jgi:hypothetical protein
LLFFVTDADQRFGARRDGDFFVADLRVRVGMGDLERGRYTREARSALVAAFMRGKLSHSHATRQTMGTKPSNNFQSDRPESGGADRRDERENSGLLAREKEKFAAEQAEKGRSSRKRASEEEKAPSKPSVNPASRKRKK